MYKSLSRDAKQMLQRGVAWAAEDLAGDIIDVTTGLPIGGLAVKGVEWVFSDSGHDINTSPTERSFNQSELIGWLNKI